MVGVAPNVEVLSLRMMLFLVPTFFLVFSICALYDNVRSSVTPTFTERLQWVKFTPFQLMSSCLPYSRFRRWKRVTCVFVGFARSWFVVTAVHAAALEIRYIWLQILLPPSIHQCWTDNTHRRIQNTRQTQDPSLATDHDLAHVNFKIKLSGAAPPARPPYSP